MRRIVVLLPQLLGDPSFLRQNLPSLARIAEQGTIFKLIPVPLMETPEAVYLGMKPHEGQMAQGPLTVSALGVDPPPRSTHFHLSLMSHQEGVASRLTVEIAETEVAQVMELAKRLNTKTLTLVVGTGVDHALVWEGEGDLRTASAREVDGQQIHPHLPEGDAETALRRYIDDSINLLSEAEVNRQRQEEGLSPINLLWPWGQGSRTPVPNLALRRGDPALVISSSLRLQGLARLSGYRHETLLRYGKDLNTRWTEVAHAMLAEPVSIYAMETFSRLRSANRIEEGNWLIHELDQQLFSPLLDEPLMRLSILAPSNEPGLGVTYQTGGHSINSLPFDERALEERSLGVRPLWECVEAGVL